MLDSKLCKMTATIRIHVIDWSQQKKIRPENKYPHHDLSTNRGNDGKVWNLLYHTQTTDLELTKLIDLVSTVQAVWSAHTQLKYLQQQQVQSLNQASLYQAEIVLNSLSKQELLWNAVRDFIMFFTQRTYR